MKLQSVWGHARGGVHTPSHGGQGASVESLTVGTQLCWLLRSAALCLLWADPAAGESCSLVQEDSA